MKLLLTSGGLENNSIINALKDLVQKPFTETKVAFIPTAANLEPGDKTWFIENLTQLQELGFSSIDIVDISALPQKIWLERLKEVDVLYVSGGNTYHLMYWFKQSGLSEILPELLNSKVYVGVSAGTVIATPCIVNADFEKYPALEIGEEIDDTGLSLVSFMIDPHINNEYFPELTMENLKEKTTTYQYSIYGIDDNTAIKVDGNNVEVVSEGIWQKFEK